MQTLKNSETEIDSQIQIFIDTKWSPEAPFPGRQFEAKIGKEDPKGTNFQL